MARDPETTAAIRASLAVGLAVAAYGISFGALSVAAGPSRSLLVGTADTLYTSVGASWNRLGAATDPVYPG